MGTQGDCVETGKVFNLIIEDTNIEKALKTSIYYAFLSLSVKCIMKEIKILVIPEISFGDIKWDEVKELISLMFKNMDINILTYNPNTKEKIEEVCNNMEGYW